MTFSHVSGFRNYPRWGAFLWLQETVSGDGELGEQVQQERDGGLGRGAPFSPLTPGEQKQLRQSAQSQGERWLEHRSQVEESFNEPLDSSVALFCLSLFFFMGNICRKSEIPFTLRRLGSYECSVRVFIHLIFCILKGFLTHQVQKSVLTSIIVIKVLVLYNHLLFVFVSW